MILQLLGFVAIIVFTVFIGKTAKENGRNAMLWAAACVGVGLGLQFVVPVLVVIVITIVLIAMGTRPDQVEAVLGWWAFGISFLFICFKSDRDVLNSPPRGPTPGGSGNCRCSATTADLRPE